MIRFDLAGAGAAGKSFLARLPRLNEQLGGVAALSHRLASRLVNTLKAGRPLKSAADLEARIVLVCAPGRAALDCVICHLLRAPIDWHGRTVLLCASDAFTPEIQRFHDAGAAIGSLNLLPHSNDCFVAEGDTAALRVSKQIGRDMKGNVLSIRRDRTELYSAAVTLSSSLFTPLLESSVECLRESGIKGRAGATVAEFLFARSLQSYMHAGRKSWSGTLAEEDWESLNKEIAGLRESNPLIAEYYRDGARFAARYFNRAMPPRARRAIAAAVPKPSRAK